MCQCSVLGEMGFVTGTRQFLMCESGDSCSWNQTPSLFLLCQSTQWWHNFGSNREETQGDIGLDSRPSSGGSLISPLMGQHKTRRSSSPHSCCPRLPPAWRNLRMLWAGRVCAGCLCWPYLCWMLGAVEEPPALLLLLSCPAALALSSAGAAQAGVCPSRAHWKDARDAGGVLGQPGDFNKWSSVAKQLGED